MSRQSSVSSYGGTAPSTGSSCFLDLDAARLRLQRSESQRSATQEQLSLLARIRASTPNMSPEELTFKDREIHALKQHLAVLEMEVIDGKNKLHDAQRTITQQQMTIHTQSKAIENPGLGRDGLLMPTKQVYGYGQSNATQSFVDSAQSMALGHVSQQSWRPAHRNTSSAQSAPIIGLPISSRDRTFNNNSASHATEHFVGAGNDGYDTGRNRFSNQTGLGHLRSRSRPVNTGQPLAYGQQDVIGNRGQHSQPFTYPNGFNPLVNQLQSPQNLQSPLSVTSSNPYPETSIPIMLQPSTVNNPDTGNEPTIGKTFQDFIDMALNWARKHANTPSTAGDSALPKPMKDKLMKAGTSKSAFNLLNDGSTRYLLVSRIMLQWMVKHIFKNDKQNTFSGLDVNADRAIQNFTEMILDNMPPTIRFAYLDTVAVYYRTICDNQHFPAFVEHLCDQRGRLLWQRICPLMHKRTSNPEDELLELIRTAHRLAALLQTSTDEFWFEFPDLDILFDPNTMINIDPKYIEPQAHQLQAARATIRLSVSPVVGSRKSTPQGPVMKTIMAQALVLITIP